MDGEHAGISLPPGVSVPAHHWTRTPEAHWTRTPKARLNQRPPTPASSSGGGAPLSSRGAALSPPDAGAEATQPSFAGAGDDPARMAQRPPPPQTPAAAARQPAAQPPPSPAATGGALNPLADANQPAYGGAPTPEQMRAWQRPQYTGLSAPETPMPVGMPMVGMQPLPLPPQQSNGDTISLKRDSFMMAMVMCALALAVSVYTLWQMDTLNAAVAGKVDSSDLAQRLS
eukprot:COSAG04_NODE_43_length_31842_cov_15.704848_1_plen_228_part_10